MPVFLNYDGPVYDKEELLQVGLSEFAGVSALRTKFFGPFPSPKEAERFLADRGWERFAPVPVAHFIHPSRQEGLFDQMKRWKIETIHEVAQWDKDYGIKPPEAIPPRWLTPET